MADKLKKIQNVKIKVSKSKSQPSQLEIFL
jgi:hypothetical protein